MEELDHEEKKVYPKVLIKLPEPDAETEKAYMFVTKNIPKKENGENDPIWIAKQYCENGSCDSWILKKICDEKNVDHLEFLDGKVFKRPSRLIKK